MPKVHLEKIRDLVNEYASIVHLDERRTLSDEIYRLVLSERVHDLTQGKSYKPIKELANNEDDLRKFYEYNASVQSDFPLPPYESWREGFIKPVTLKNVVLIFKFQDYIRSLGYSNVE